MIKIGLSGEVFGWSLLMVAADVGVCRVPVSARGDRVGGALVPALLPVLPRRRGTAGRARCRLWDIATGESIATLTGHTSQVSVAGFSPNGETIATVGD